MISRGRLPALSWLALTAIYSTAAAASTGIQGPITYGLTPGTHRIYTVKALFDGRFPPFDQPGNPPVHLAALLTYDAHVLSSNNEGATVSFTVTHADINLIANRIKLDAKPDPNNEIPYPIDLHTVQSALDSEVILRPDGSIARVLSKSSNLIKVNIGFDLRKLFTLMMPVVFPGAGVAPVATWSNDTGVIGSSPASVHYTTTLTGANAHAQGLTLSLTQAAQSNISDTLNAAGESTSNATKAVTKLAGTVDLKSTMQFVSTSPSAANTVELARGRYDLTVHLTRAPVSAKAKSEDAQFQSGPIDVTGRMLVILGKHESKS